MAKIVIEIVAGSKYHGDYKTFESDEVHIGRGFNNDIILSDSYVSAQHLVVFRQGDKIKIKDLSSKNGTYMPKFKRKVRELVIASGDELILGHTKIRIFLDSHKMKRTKVLNQNSQYIRLLKKPAVVWFLFFVLMGMMFWEGYLATTTKEPWHKLLPYPIFTLIILLSWAGFWTFIGRLIRHKIRFLIHISIFCLWVFVYNIFDNLNAYISFYMNNQVLYTVLSYLLYSGLFTVILYSSLSFSTNMSNKSKIVFSGLLTLSLILFTIGLLVSYSDYYLTGGSPYSKILKPPVLGAPKGKPIDQFMAKTDRIFKFKIKEDEI